MSSRKPSHSMFRAARTTRQLSLSNRDATSAGQNEISCCDVRDVFTLETSERILFCLCHWFINIKSTVAQRSSFSSSSSLLLEVFPNRSAVWSSCDPRGQQRSEVMEQCFRELNLLTRTFKAWKSSNNFNNKFNNRIAIKFLKKVTRDKVKNTLRSLKSFQGSLKRFQKSLRKFEKVQMDLEDVPGLLEEIGSLSGCSRSPWRCSSYVGHWRACSVLEGVPEVCREFQGVLKEFSNPWGGSIGPWRAPGHPWGGSRSLWRCCSNNKKNNEELPVVLEGVLGILQVPVVIEEVPGEFGEFLVVWKKLINSQGGSNGPLRGSRDPWVR